MTLIIACVIWIMASLGSGQLSCEYSIDCNEQAQCLEQVCVCNDGWIGEGYFSCTDVNECDASPCNEATEDCINTVGSYICECKQGLEANPLQQCLDIDECASFPCDELRETCENTFGSFNCLCREGFALKGTTLCEDIDECALMEDECQMDCLNTEPGYKCSCKPGYYVDDDDDKRCKPSSGLIIKLVLDMDFDQDLNNPSTEYYRLVTDTVANQLIYPSGVAGRGLDYLEFDFKPGVVITVGLFFSTPQSSEDLDLVLFHLEETTRMYSNLLVVGADIVNIKTGPVLVEKIGLKPEMQSCELFNLFDYCKMGSKCEIIDNQPRCRCPDGYFGEQCTLERDTETRFFSDVEITLIVVSGIILLLLLLGSWYFFITLSMRDKKMERMLKAKVMMT